MTNPLDRPVTVTEVSRFLDVMYMKFDDDRRITDMEPGERPARAVNAALTDFLARRKRDGND